ncbi:MAG: energy transducer TonB, partial [Moraxellaceae bacterium]
MRLQQYLSICLSFLFTTLCSLAHAADPMLNGIAVHSELGKEQFIGALYSNPLSDNADTLISSAQSMRMELKIVAPEGLTTRRFSRMWIEGMAINNPSALLTEQADNMVKFDGLFKGRLAQNDNIVFSFEPGKGVNVVVNDVTLGNIPSDKFIGMLLRTWVGKVPLSSDYKEGILKVGKVSP